MHTGPGKNYYLDAYIGLPSLCKDKKYIFSVGFHAHFHEAT